MQKNTLSGVAVEAREDEILLFGFSGVDFSVNVR
jgi:hypothetical protein